MRPAAATILLALFSSLLCTVSPTPFPINPVTAGLNNALTSFCSNTNYFDLCLTSIKETAHGLTIPSNNNILPILMQAVEAKAHKAKAFALHLTKSSVSNSKTRELLKDCVNAYDDALDNLSKGIEAIKAHDGGARDSLLSSMIANFGSCEDGFQEFAIKSPMADWSKTLQQMVDNCLAIINMSRSKN